MTMERIFMKKQQIYNFIYILPLEHGYHIRCTCSFMQQLSFLTIKTSQVKCNLHLSYVLPYDFTH
jgi:hypothetical protein